MKDLTPRDGAPKRIPNESMTPAQRAEMAEIEKMTADADAGFAVMAQEMIATADATAGSEAALLDIKAILTKVCMHFQIPLPAYMLGPEGTFDPDIDPQSEAENDGDEDEDEDKEPET